MWSRVDLVACRGHVLESHPASLVGALALFGLAMQALRVLPDWPHAYPTGARVCHHGRTQLATVAACPATRRPQRCTGLPPRVHTTCHVFAQPLGTFVCAVAWSRQHRRVVFRSAAHDYPAHCGQGGRRPPTDGTCQARGRAWPRQHGGGDAGQEALAVWDADPGWPGGWPFCCCVSFGVGVL
jgi:hypothetical protein